MFRRIILGCLVLFLAGSASGYARTQTYPPAKVKPAKVKTQKVNKPKPAKPPQPTGLTSNEKAFKKANDKNIKAQQKAFAKQNKQQSKALKTPQKTTKKS